jgi:hypothetical protein
MPDKPTTTSDRRHEAERLIDLARGMLVAPAEKIVVNYLDHAIEALHIVMESERPRPD